MLRSGLVRCTLTSNLSCSALLYSSSCCSKKVRLRYFSINICEQEYKIEILSCWKTLSELFNIRHHAILCPNLSRLNCGNACLYGRKTYILCCWEAWSHLVSWILYTGWPYRKHIKFKFCTYVCRCLQGSAQENLRLSFLSIQTNYLSHYMIICKYFFLNAHDGRKLVSRINFLYTCPYCGIAFVTIVKP